MEQEERMRDIFAQLDKLFKKAEKTKNPEKIHQMMKDISEKCKECKA